MKVLLSNKEYEKRSLCVADLSVSVMYWFLDRDIQWRSFAISPDFCVVSYLTWVGLGRHRQIQPQSVDQACSCIIRDKRATVGREEVRECGHTGSWIPPQRQPGKAWKTSKKVAKISLAHTCHWPDKIVHAWKRLIFETYRYFKFSIVAL